MNNIYYAIAGKLAYYTQKQIDFKLVDVIAKIKRLSKKHQYLAECSCNGEGFIRGQRYYSGKIDDYATRTYGYNVKSSYIKDDVEIWDIESDKIENRINQLIKDTPLKVEYQGDPRGATVKLSMDSVNITEVLY